jgi:hypothetical protein
MLRTVFLIFQNEFHLLVKDRVGLFMLLLAPVVIIAVAGFSLGKRDHWRAAHSKPSSTQARGQPERSGPPHLDIGPRSDCEEYRRLIACAYTEGGTFQCYEGMYWHL